jgi:dolichol-phosphate mannosyltransferase
MMTLSIICPVHNEADVVPLFYQRLAPVFARLSRRYKLQLVFLNNASSDGTLEAIRSLIFNDSSVFVITMSRNVGYQASLECGLRRVESDVYAFIDVDCEDPPEMLLEFVDKLEDGYDISYGERVDRVEPAALKLIRKLFYRILQAVSDDEIILDMAEFSLFTREVRDAIISDHTSFPFLRASIARVGFRRAAIPFKRQLRVSGESHYNLLRMTVFAVAGILASSTLLLRVPIILFPLWLIALTEVCINYGNSGSPAQIAAAVWLTATFCGMTLSTTALYVARTYKNGLGRPNAFIDRRLSILPPARAPGCASSQDEALSRSASRRAEPSFALEPRG